MQLANRIKNKDQFIYIVYCLFFVIWALLQLWGSRFFEHYSDGISYLDMASYYVRGDFSSGFSSFWNILYPIFIAFIFLFLRPDAAHEFLCLKIVNFSIFVFLLFSFQLFLNQFKLFYSEQIKEKDQFIRLSDTAWTVFACGIFAYAFLCLNSISVDTPDMLSAALMLLSLTSFVKIYRYQGKSLDYVIFAFFAALSYLAKAAALPMAIICLFFLWRQARKLNDNKSFLMASALFLLLILPYVFCLSLKVGEPTFSTAAKLNYIWFVDEKKCDLYGQVQNSKRASLLHPMRQIYAHPNVFEFIQPIKGTFPPWYDPYYWYEGYKISFQPLWIFITIFCDLLYYGKTIFGACFASLVAMFLCYRKPITSLRAVACNLPLLLISLIGFLQYAPIINLAVRHPPFLNRYFGLAITLLALAVMASIRLANNNRGLAAFKWTMFVIAIMIMIPVTEHFLSDLNKAFEKKTFAHLQVANELRKFGLEDGDYVMRIGLKEPLVDWARLARVKIVVDIPKSDEFWRLSSDDQNKIFHLCKEKNIVAAVYCGSALTPESLAWQQGNYDGWLSYLNFKKENKSNLSSDIVMPNFNKTWHKVNGLDCWLVKLVD